ncbi:MAG: rRNA maturation RNase YbeY [Candidatus Omnitrophica bacterium]|nr:rRNA maturation RNase YbeY [Candidatus Omnitrophota bacterium]
MIRVTIRNQNKKRPVDLLKIERIVKKVLRAEGKKNADVNMVFLSNQKIRAFNRAYLGKDRATDVLAFPLENEQKKTARGTFPKDSVLMKRNTSAENVPGDIAISSDKAFSNAKVFKTSFKEEIALYVIHGVLHLLGYCDKSKNERVLMREKENEYMLKA